MVNSAETALAGRFDHYFESRGLEFRGLWVEMAHIERGSCGVCELVIVWLVICDVASVTRGGRWYWWGVKVGWEMPRNTPSI